jgi:hypothetical protein
MLVNMFYVDQKILIYVLVDDKNPEHFTAESDVVGVSYLSSSRMEKITTELTPIKWTGYADLLSYQPPTPEPTVTGQSTEEVIEQTPTVEVTPTPTLTSTPAQ